jgi:Spy/CpxP family protein refolding chaperone
MAAMMNPGDPNYAAAVQAAKKRAADRIQRFSDLTLQLYNVLTPDQKAQLSKSKATWKARMAQHAQGPKGPPAPADR